MSLVILANTTSPRGAMTTVTGTLTTCSSGTQSTTYTFTGPLCYKLALFPGSTCTPNADSTSVHCTSGVACADNASIFESNFSLSQDGQYVMEETKYGVEGQEFVVKSDGRKDNGVI